MNRRHLTALAGAIGMVAIATADQQQSGASKTPPPLVVEDDAPLLLEEPTEADRAAASQPAKALADNKACFVCHENYKEEPLAVVHAVKEIGCVKCHGDSFAHRNDENNVTPPETMYPAKRINASCEACHEAHDVPAVKVLGCWQERGLTDKDPQRIVCTDCHGRHRLEIRTVRWNKRTGKLIAGQEEDRKKHPTDPSARANGGGRPAPASRPSTVR